MRDIFDYTQEQLEHILNEVALQCTGKGMATSGEFVVNAYYAGSSLFTDLILDGKVMAVIRFNLLNQSANLFTGGKIRLLSLKSLVLLEKICQLENKSIMINQRVTNLISEKTRDNYLMLFKSFNTNN